MPTTKHHACHKSFTRDLDDGSGASRTQWQVLRVLGKPIQVTAEDRQADRLRAAANLLDIDGVSVAALWPGTVPGRAGGIGDSSSAAEEVPFTAEQGSRVFAQHTGAVSAIAAVRDRGGQGRWRWSTWAVIDLAGDQPG